MLKSAQIIFLHLLSLQIVFFFIKNPMYETFCLTYYILLKILLEHEMCSFECTP
jgi:type IV secretory pathway VirB3-like protein